MTNTKSQHEILKEIIARRLNQDPLSQEQESILSDWLKDPLNAATYETLVDDRKRYEAFLQMEQSSRKVKSVIDRALQDQYRATRVGPNRFWRTLPQWAAAVLVVCAVGYFLLIKKEAHRGKFTANGTATIAPGSDKAILTLGNGEHIVLNGIDTAHLANQGKASIQQLGGQLSYDDQLASNEVVMNLLTTPRGGKYIVTLGDGSKIWLNAATKVRYPSSFTGATRTIELVEGEMYLEVTRNEKMPFIVKLPARDGDKGLDITVLGTHFNVHAYPSETSIRTTLLEGKVLVTKGTSRQILAPLQQALTNTGSDNISLIENVKVDTVVDWTLDKFAFNNDKLTTVMHKISIWYDVDIEYIDDPTIDAKNIRTDARGAISRKASLDQLLMLLKFSGVKYEIEGRVLKVFI